MAQQGFKLEDSQKKPTMKVGEGSLHPARTRPSRYRRKSSWQDAVATRRGKIWGLARSVYERSSISSHVTTSKGEVIQIKMYVDTVLAELLEIHRSRTT